MNKKLYKSRSNRVLSGVCGGFGEYLGIDPVVLRIIWLVLLLMFGVGGLAYIICIIVMPQEPAKSDYVDVESKPSE